MKKVLIILLLCIPLTTFADEVYFRSTSLAIKIEGVWSDWMDTSVKIKVTDDDKVIIYSDDPQIYRIIEEKDPPYDSKGKQIAYKVLDQDGDYGTLRFRQENSGGLQLYIDFVNISWVYCIKRL